MSHESGVKTIGLMLHPTKPVTDSIAKIITLAHPHAGPGWRLSAGDHANLSRIKLSLLDLPLRQDQLLELIPAELRERAELSVRRSRPADQPG